MKYTQIIYNGPMVRQVQAGNKTETRRIAKLSPSGRVSYQGYHWHPEDPKATLGCPFGQVGDRLWVRETFAEVPRALPLTDEDRPFRKDGRIVVYQADPQWDGARQYLCADGVLRWAKPARWTPSIHMPRWASRFTQELTGVQLERLQDIDEAGAIAEGIHSAYGEWRDYRTKPEINFPVCSSPIDSFRTLWESIYGDGSWDANPLVWSLSTKLVEATAGVEAFLLAEA